MVGLHCIIIMLQSNEVSYTVFTSLTRKFSYILFLLKLEFEILSE